MRSRYLIIAFLIIVFVSCESKLSKKHRLVGVWEQRTEKGFLGRNPSIMNIDTSKIKGSFVSSEIQFRGNEEVKTFAIYTENDSINYRKISLPSQDTTIITVELKNYNFIKITEIDGSVSRKPRFFQKVSNDPVLDYSLDLPKSPSQ